MQFHVFYHAIIVYWPEHIPGTARGIHYTVTSKCAVVTRVSLQCDEVIVIVVVTSQASMEQYTKYGLTYFKWNC